MTAELLLALRLSLADGAADARAFAVLRRAALSALGPDESGLEEILSEIEQLVACAGVEAVAAALRSLPRQRRALLARRLTDIAAADAGLEGLQPRLAARVGIVLGLEAAPDAPDAG